MSPLRTIALALAVAFVAVPSATAARAATGGGFDDWACRPGARHPDPVVLLHGLGGDPKGNWSYVGPALAADGYCAFSDPYSPPGRWPFYGLASMDDASTQIAAFIQRVLGATRAHRVALVGHSEGAFLALYVPKTSAWATGPDKRRYAAIGRHISRVVAIAPPTHGTTFLGLVTVGQATGTMAMNDRFLREQGCPACADLVAGGPAIERLNRGPIVQPRIAYTVIASRTDALVRNESYSPATDTAFVREPRVVNEYVQDRCPADPVGHVGLAYDSYVLGLIRHGLDAAVAPAPCTVGLPA